MSKIFVVSTPIGNISDISQRALEILSEVDIIACEDTRKTGKLLSIYGIKGKLISYHDHNKDIKIPFILDFLKQGKSMALVSDAGTPTISDPGYRLISECRKAGILVNSVPGPSACIAALSVSGFPSDRFSFEGFVPHKKGRESFFSRVVNNDSTVIFYESVHRIEKTLNKLIELAPKREISLHREITKVYENCYQGYPQKVFSDLKEDSIKGEFVVILKGLSKKEIKAKQQ